jgi:hypothetical protein
MEFVAGEPLDGLEAAPPAERDRVAALLIDLVLRELLEWGWMQTDPNLANYRLEPGTGRVVLYDFGATRLVEDLRERGMALVADRSTWRAPPRGTLFVQRKLGGTYLMAARLRARADLRALLDRRL